MKPLAEAQREVLAAMTPLPAAEVPLDRALGLALAGDVVAPHPVPPFANSAMDGFAVRSADVASPPVRLTVVGDLAAGSIPDRGVEPGTAMRIMTGAPIPDGGDAVVMVEDTEPAGGEMVNVKVAVSPGENVRPAGGDFPAGAPVLGAGERLGPAHLGVLASIGVSRPLVHRRPRVALLSTGDELVPPETDVLAPGAIRDSNRPMLAALLAEAGAEVADFGIVPDDPDRLRATLEEAAQGADAVVSSGGVSMGAYDLVKQVLSELGRIEFWRVAMQPAKPFAFGFLGDTPLFGLPGNPVSVTVSFEQFVRPALLKRMGARRLFRPRGTAVLAEDVSTNPDKVVFPRMAVRRQGDGWVARLAGGQGSNVLSALAAADAFGVVPVGVGDLAAGQQIEIEWFRSPELLTMEEVFDE